MSISIDKGSIVLYGEGHYQVTFRTATTVNLGNVWDRSRIRHKKVPIELVKEDGEAFYKNWEESESYQCM
jgi:hypothetical protein